MLRYLLQRFAGSGDSDSHRNDRVKEENLQEFIKYKQLMRHGFPQKASCLSVDSELGLLAVGTKDGDFSIVGSSNTEWSSSLGSSASISSIHFIPKSFTLISISDHTNAEPSQNIHKIQIEKDGSLKIDSATPNPCLKRICSSTVVCRPNAVPFYLIGTVSGNLYHFKISTLAVTDLVVFEDLVDEENTVDFPPSKRAITLLHPCRSDGRYLIVVIEKSLLIIFDLVRMAVLKRMKVDNGVASTTFSHPNPDKLIIGHSDGSYSKFKIDFEAELRLTAEEEDVFLYGPYKSTPITQIDYFFRDREEILIYSGGLPEASFGDRHGVTVKSRDKHVILDYDSSITIFSLLFSSDPALFVLCEQELSAIDLRHPTLKPFMPPYFYPMHFSPISSAQLISNVNEQVFAKLCSASQQQQRTNTYFSQRDWPLFGRTSIDTNGKACHIQNERTLLVTGHDNGSVVFWQANTVNLRPMLIYQSAREFEGFDEQQNDGDDERSTEEEEWPPFKRRGIFESFCDDPRFSVDKIIFSEKTGTLVIGGRAGHVLVYEFHDHSETCEPLSILEVDMVGATQKHESNSSNARIVEVPLPPRRSVMKYPPGLLPCFDSMVQLKPPVAVQTLAWNASSRLVAVGIEFGYLVCDIERRQILCKMSLLPPDEIVEMVNNDGQLSRFKSMKKTIRQSFRRKRRSPTRNGHLNASMMIQDLRPIEREIVARPRNGASTSTLIGGSGSVKMIRFVHAPIGEDTAADLLLVGTSGGILHIHKASLSDRCKKIREIRLTHQANVLHADVSKNMLIIYTEEQIRCFSLPSLKPARYKYRLTALEGSRIFSVHNLQLQSIRDPRTGEQFVAVLSNRGEVFIFAPGITRLLTKITFTNPTDGSGIKSAIMSTDGTLFWQRAGGSEYQRATLSTKPQFPNFTLSH
ncbi:hypothetical protein FO519_007263 [Halicephalobus sp. NKZ332]|nr:hypothetical protein FO519_007263 [Halicephalobus sp. NKZ332]